MFTDLIDDILIRIIDLLNYKDYDPLLCSSKFINKFMLNRYFEYKIITNNIPISFCASGCSNNLNTLILFGDNNISDVLLRCLPKLKHLKLLSNNKITDEGLKYIPNITNLNLKTNDKITDDGLKYIPNVTILNLKNNMEITNDGLKYIPNITKLNLKTIIIK